MDVHQRPPDVDRRTLVRLGAGAVLVGTVPVLADEPVVPESDVRSMLASLQKVTANLASAYDEAGPAKVAAYVPKLRTVAARIVADTSVPARLVTGAKAEYTKLLTMFAAANEDLGDYPRAIQSGTMAASIAQEIGDHQTEGHAWWVVAGSQCFSGRKRTARKVAQRGCAVARNLPAGISARLTESFVAAQMGDKFAVFGLVTEAERAHARLPESDWGKPGYEFGTLYPSTVKAHAGARLAAIGLYAEAAPRLEEAADMLTGTVGGEKAYVWLLQARCLLGTGDLDGALHLASAAVAHEAPRPSAWVARRVRELDKRTRDRKLAVGPFSDLVRLTSGWGTVSA